MNKQYKIQNGIDGKPKSVTILGENICIPFDNANTDYQEYLKWLEAGNTPLPADEISE
jgi:hypothetical protein